jgi:hypothetical protein
MSEPEHDGEGNGAVPSVPPAAENAPQRAQWPLPRSRQAIDEQKAQWAEEIAEMNRRLDGAEKGLRDVRPAIDKELRPVRDAAATAIVLLQPVFRRENDAAAEVAPQPGKPAATK